MVYVIYGCKQDEVKCLQTLPMYDDVPSIRATQVVKCKRGSWEGKKTHRFIQASNQYYMGINYQVRERKILKSGVVVFLSMLMCAFLLHPNFSCMRFPYKALFDLEGFCR